MSGKQTIRALLALAALVLLAAGTGCSPSTDLGGTEVPNALPDTRLTGAPPTLREADFIVRFWWTGNDPDGRLRGYQWKLSDNGLDGISVLDTLTIDPASGAVINPWRFTAATDSSFIVSADEPGFPDDDNLPLADRRSFQTHTLFVRAVDEDGGVDPTPAMVSFTSTTLTPTISVTDPAGFAGRREWSDAPPSVTLGWTGNDPDFDLGAPVRVRYIWKQALYGPCLYINGEYVWLQYGHLVLSNSDSAWSDWIPYRARPEDRRVTFPNQQEFNRSCPAGSQKIGYIFAIQAQDTAGAVTPYLTYGVNVINVKITSAQSPLLRIVETYLGEYENTGVNGVWGPLDIAQNQPLEFSWIADASGYAGIVQAYRYGWDVADVTNDLDPGWRIQWGNSSQHRRAPVTSFSSGLHTLTVECRDNSSQITRIRVDLNVVPVKPRELQDPLLLLDDVLDKNSNAWTVGGIPYDRDNVRDAFWEDVLAGSEQLVGFDPEVHVRDAEESQIDLGYAVVVNYRNLLWTHKKSIGSFVANTFDISVTDRYVWLGTYQQQVGNVFMCGQQVLNSFVGDIARFQAVGSQPQALPILMPMIFDTPETYTTCNNQRWALGWGERELPDGTTQLVGPTLYPYRIWGVVALDQCATSNTLFPCAGTGQTARKASCSGLKAIVLDPAFKAQYVDPGAMADTIFTWRTLDSRDYPTAPAFPRLSLPFNWGLDEFYDRNITSRTTAVVPQQRQDGGPMIEPMFKYYSRYDWIDDVYANRGIPQWPTGYLTTDSLNAYCGRQILGTSGRTKVEGATVAFLSNKTVATKPGGRGDVLWGFDPSRFDRAKIIKAVRWVLREQFGLPFVASGKQNP